MDRPMVASQQATLSKILIVEDDVSVSDALATLLVANGYAKEVAADADRAIERLAEGGYACALVDLTLPGGRDGLEVARIAISKYSVPVIIVTGRGEEVDRVLGLEIGADDYVVKPFSSRELLARLKNVLKRAAKTETAGPPPADHRPRDARIFSFVGFRLDLDRNVVLAPDGGVISLTPSEFSLLTAFVRHPQFVLSRARLLEEAKGDRDYAWDRSVDVHVFRLRSKLEKHNRDEPLIQTVRGLGYLFSPAVSHPG